MKQNRQKRIPLLALVIAAFLVSIAPLYLLGLYIYNIGVFSIEKITSDLTISQTSLFMNNLDADINSARLLQNGCLQDRNLDRIANLSDYLSRYEIFESTLELQRRLLTITQSSEYIQDVVVFLPDIRRMISAASGVSDVDDKTNEYIRQLVTIRNKGNIAYLNDRIICVANSPFVLRNGALPKRIITVEISMEKLQKSLTNFDSQSGSGDYILLDMHTGEIVATTAGSTTNDFVRTVLDWEKFTDAAGYKSIEIGEEKQFICYVESKVLDVLLLKIVPEQQIFHLILSYKDWLLFFSIASVLVIVIFSLIIFTFLQKPMKLLIKAFKKVENGEFGFSISYHFNNEFKYLFHRFNEMVKNLGTLIDQEYKQKIYVQAAELRQLQLQINPHFLYNSFFILYSMIEEEDYESMAKLTKLLGTYFEFISHDKRQEVPLSHEVTHARAYAEIQLIRFSRCVTLEFCDLPTDFYDLMVPRLILQPLIENVFEHGFKNKIGEQRIRVLFMRTDDGLDICVEDNGNEMDDNRLSTLQQYLTSQEADRDSLALLNIQRRIHLYFKDGSGLFASRSELGGLRMVIHLKRGA